MNTFSQGQQLSQASICNGSCIFTGVVVKRTAKTLTISQHGYDDKRCKIHLDSDGDEYIYPLGQYSMSPTFRA